MAPNHFGEYPATTNEDLQQRKDLSVAGKTAKTPKAPSIVPSAQLKTNASSDLSMPLPKLDEEQIRMLAYLKWEAAGMPLSDGTVFWLAAEQELSQPLKEGLGSRDPAAIR